MHSRQSIGIITECLHLTHTHPHTHADTHTGRALLVFPLTHGNRFRCSSTPQLSGLTFHWKQITLFLSRSLINTHLHTYPLSLHTLSISLTISPSALLSLLHPHLWPSSSLSHLFPMGALLFLSVTQPTVFWFPFYLSISIPPLFLTF